MKKILIDCRWLSIKPRGIGVFNQGLLDGLHRVLVIDGNFDITLLINRDLKQYCECRYGNFFKYISTFRFPDPIYDLILIQLLQFIFRFDLIHLTGNTGPFYFLNKPILITTIHDVSFMKDFNFNNRKSLHQKIGMLYRRYLVPRVAKYSDLVITVSNFASKDISFETKINYEPYVIGHGVAFYYPNIKKKNSQNYFIAISGSDPQKNINTVIEAFSMLEAETQNSHELKIVGLSLDEFININPEIKLSSGIEFCGKLNHQDTLLKIQNSICTIVPSHYESFGLPVIESLLMGIPVICSATGALNGIAGDAALYFDPTNAFSLKVAILKFCEDGISKARLDKWVHENRMRYSWEYASSEYLDRYKFYL